MSTRRPSRSSSATSHHKAAEILAGLPMQKQIEVISRIANMEQTNPGGHRRKPRRTGRNSLANMLMQSMEKAGGINTVAEILNLADRATEKAVMEGLEAEDPELVEEIRRLMFVFEDILKVDDKGIQQILKEVDNAVSASPSRPHPPTSRTRSSRTCPSAPRRSSRGHAVHGPRCASAMSSRPSSESSTSSAGSRMPARSSPAAAAKAT